MYGYIKKKNDTLIPSTKLLIEQYDLPHVIFQNHKASEKCFNILFHAVLTQLTFFKKNCPAILAEFNHTLPC